MPVGEGRQAFQRGVLKLPGARPVPETSTQSGRARLTAEGSAITPLTRTALLPCFADLFAAIKIQ
jgi:hypothetical protein